MSTVVWPHRHKKPTGAALLPLPPGPPLAERMQDPQDPAPRGDIISDLFAPRRTPVIVKVTDGISQAPRREPSTAARVAETLKSVGFTAVTENAIQPDPGESATEDTRDVAAAVPQKSAAGTEGGDAAMPGKVRIVMAGGGTGGHLYPGLAVAEALQRKLGDRLELIWAATPRPVDQRLLAGFGDNYVQQAVQPLVKKLSRLWPFWKAWKQSVAYWEAAFAAKPVDAVLALGGYAAGPAAYVASKAGIPVGLLNPDALPGLANRFLLKRSDRIFAQWDLPPHLTRNVRGRVLAVGCPIRTGLLGRDRAEAAARLGLDPAKRTLVVTGASLGAKTINDAMVLLLSDPNVIDALKGAESPTVDLAPGQPMDIKPEQWQILHLAGLEQAAAVRAAYEKLTGVAWKVLDYCDDMASVWAVADLAIVRAGASTCAELTACGVPSLLLPYPFHRDNHQRHNAQQLVTAGAARLIDDRKDARQNAAAIKSDLLPLLYGPETRARMAEGAQVAGKPHAAEVVADELLSLIRNR